MHFRGGRFVWGLCCVLLAATSAAADVGLRAPAGFEVSLFAGDDLAHDIFSMTLDSQGRVVVAGRDYVKTLHDDDRDGRADRATLFANKPASGAHGLLFLGNDLLATGDDSVMLLRDEDADGAADGQPEAWTRLRHPEHGANGIVRGPDGWVYVICGNDAGVAERHAAKPGSPVSQPQCGAVLRFSPDGRQSEIVAHGFRNPYDCDFNALGQLFTVDADGERDHHLPWYAPNRLFDVAQGMHHGWVLSGWQRSWNRPAYFFDNVERLVEIGRGSPTGLVVYRHTQFPQRYRGSVLSCCWTLGRVYHLPLAAERATYASPHKAEVFLETTGEVGIAPVDLAVGPQGELYIAIGGRRTRGSVFRVKWDEEEDRGQGTGDSDALTNALGAPQPLAAWSRARWEPLARLAGREAVAGALQDERQPLAQRIRAVEILTDLFDGLSVHEARQAIDAGPPELAARALWSLARQPRDGDAIRVIVSTTGHENPRVQRAAWEALGNWPQMGGTMSAILGEADWQRGFASPDRRVRAAALVADARRDAPIDGSSPADLWRRAFRGQLEPPHFAAAAESFFAAETDDQRLGAVRLMELALGDINTQPMQADVYAGYALSASSEAVADAGRQWGAKLAGAFPGSDANLNLELARLLGMIAAEDPPLLARIGEQFTTDSLPQHDVHYLIVLSRLPGTRSPLATERAAAGLARLQHKMQAQAMYISRNWPARVGEALLRLYERDPALSAAVIGQPQFSLPAQAILAAHMSPADRQVAARKLLRAVGESQGELRWTDELVALAGELPPDESLPALRLAWEDFARRDAIVEVLAQDPQPADRPLLVESLSAVQATTVERAARALAELARDGQSAQEKELFAALAALKQACLAPEGRETRTALAGLLAAWSSQAIEIDERQAEDLLAAYQPWFDWFAATYPESAPQLAAFGAATAGQWQERVDKVDWESGDATRGRLVFERKACQKCHAGNSPLGPDLAGAAGRLSRADLLAAIVDPNKDVSPLYQTTQVVTGAGKVVTGLIVYESPDATLVQTTPDDTVRVAGDEILAMRKSRVSLMPAGLLNDVTDQELADLFAHLKTLQAQR